MKTTHKQLLGAGLVILNLLVLTPVTWMASYLWDENKTWRRETDDIVADLNKQLADLRADIAVNYVTRAELQSHCDRINDRLINLKK